MLAMAVSGKETTGGKVVSVILFMLSMGVLSICLCELGKLRPLAWFHVLIIAARRVQNVRDWTRLPVVCWC